MAAGGGSAATVGIVVVSHSHALATAAVALAAEMVAEADRPAVEVAAGLDETTFGTDAAAVAEAIGRADSGQGVLVLLDLGSAVLSAEMALEFIDPELTPRVRVSPAPLVEGLVAAVVTASTGADLDAVAAEAGRGLLAKVQQLGAEGPDHADRDGDQRAGTDGGAGAAEEAAPDALTRTLEVSAPHGLHARPAARFVRAVNSHRDASAQVRNVDTGAGPVDARSLTAIATLGARQGHRIEVSATGAGAERLLDDLTALAASGFGDLEPAEAEPPSTAGASITAQNSGSAPAAPVAAVDAALGPALRLGGQITDAERSAYRPGDSAAEGERLEDAVAAVRERLEALAAQPGDAAAIFAAHLALLDDPQLREPAAAAIAQGSPAPRAWQHEVDAARARFEAMDDPYLRDRAQDVDSVGDRVTRAVLGLAEPAAPGGAGDGGPRRVLVVDQLDPATAAGLDARRIAAVVTLGGGATGHGVLIARARGIPVVTGAGRAADVPDGTMLGVLAQQGRVVVDPDADEQAAIEQQIADSRARAEQAMAHAAEPARTTDGHEVRVKANVGSVGDATLAAASGADGSGLVRTEVLFADRTTAPTVDEQVEAFAAVAAALDGRPITIRTWDIGGDKPLPFHPQPPEANPFLGVRGLRTFRADPALLVDQLEAVCRVAAEHPVRVMFPMVATVAEVDWALERLDEAAARLDGERPSDLEVGIMIEVPAAALRAEALTVQLDFVSIGSNDLTQYVMAAERGSAALDELSDAADPAVLELIRLTCEGVAEGVQVCVCGDAASDPALVALLVGLGVSELSASPAAVPLVKQALRATSLAAAQDLAQRALRCDSAAEVRALLPRP